jgi:pSer/pThr/pTyr-binding forkhead associated (FHA) protein
MQIGRADACHVRLEDRYASQFHARLFPRNGSWYVEDLGSTNGTYLNRQRLHGSSEVHAGDVVRIGKTTLELRR